MSIRATDYAWEVIETAGLGHAAEVVLLRLAYHHNDTDGADYGRCNPSTRYLADRLGRHQWTIRRALAELEAAGIIRGERRPGRPTQWDFPLAPYLSTVRAPARAQTDVPVRAHTREVRAPARGVVRAPARAEQLENSKELGPVAARGVWMAARDAARAERLGSGMGATARGAPPAPVDHAAPAAPPDRPRLRADMLRSFGL